MHSLLKNLIIVSNALFYALPSFLIGRMQRIQRIQNIAARIVTRSKTSDHITHVLCQLHWVPIVQRIRFKVILQVFKCVNGIAPAYIFKTSSVDANNQGLRDPPVNSWLMSLFTRLCMVWQAHACEIHYHHISAGSVMLNVLNCH